VTRAPAPAWVCRWPPGPARLRPLLGAQVWSIEAGGLVYMDGRPKMAGGREGMLAVIARWERSAARAGT
jgi:hypothetical protein